MSKIMFANKNKTTNKLIIKLVMILSISFFNSINALAAADHIYQSGYQYSEKDIVGVLNHNVTNHTLVNVEIKTPIDFSASSQNDINIYINSVVGSSHLHNSVIVPINTGGHWVALVVKHTAVGVKAIYNNNSGAIINEKARLALVAAGVDIVDLHVAQPQDSNGCGAFTTENLIHIANAADSSTVEELRAIVRGITDSANLRIVHARALGIHLPTIEESKPEAKLAVSEIESQNRQLIKNLRTINSLTHNRLRHLNRSSDFAGLASGDEGLNQGVWAKGFMGSETDKVSSSKVKSNLYGFILGVDTKIDEDITIGAAYNHAASESKQKLQGALTSTDKIDSDIVTLYGNSIINDDVSLSANVSFGKATIKTPDQLVASKLSKQKGDLLGSSFVFDYTLYSNESFAIEPRLGLSYNSLSLKRYENASIKIAKIRQQQVTLDTGVVLTSFHDINSFALMPEISADYSYAVWNKGNTVKVNNHLNQAVLAQKISNNKNEFKLGAALTVVSDRIEIGGGYDHIIQGKSRSHISYAKLRVNF